MNYVGKLKGGKLRCATQSPPLVSKKTKRTGQNKKRNSRPGFERETGVTIQVLLKALTNSATQDDEWTSVHHMLYSLGRSRSRVFCVCVLPHCVCVCVCVCACACMCVCVQCACVCLCIIVCAFYLCLCVWYVIGVVSWGSKIEPEGLIMSVNGGK